MATVSVIIAARNAAETLGATLAGLAAQDIARGFEVVVVDDGSTDATAAVAEAAPLEVTLVRAGGVGPGPARNAGVAASSGELLAFTDADCVPSPSWLAAGTEALADHDLVQGAVHADPHAPAGPFARTVWVTREGGLYECASLFVRRERFETLGGFEDWLGAQIGKPLAEDAWFGWRLRRAGGRTAFSDAALVHHAVFDRGVSAFVAERARLVYFPVIARRMPELRDTLFYRSAFLSKRSAAFDLALAGALVARLGGTRLPLAAAIPWAVLLARRSAAFRGRAPLVAAGEAAADAVGCAALVLGSIRARTVLI